ncbi:hypothetical protein RUND412_005742 [Rhizina undulata]
MVSIKMSKNRKHSISGSLDTKQITLETPGTPQTQIRAAKRKVLAHAFTETALKSMEPYYLPHIENLCNIIASGEQSLTIPDSNKEKDSKWRGDMGKRVNYLTFDIMGELTFGKDFGMLYEETNRGIPYLIVDSTKRVLMCATFPILDRWHLDTFLFRKMTKNLNAFLKYVAENDEKRAKIGAGRKDFFGYLLSTRELDETAYSMEELFAEARILIVASSDTTATLIAGSLFYLTRNPSIKEKLMAEVRSTFNSLDDIRPGKTIGSCHYLKACIQETLRISPSVPGLLPRVVLPGGLRIGDKSIPPALKSDPLTYRPERWLKEDGNGLDADMFGAFAPFLIGSRGCIGKRVAYIEAELTLAKLMWAFEAKYISGGVEQRIVSDEYMLIDYFAVERHGPVVEFEKRVDVVS